MKLTVSSVILAALVVNNSNNNNHVVSAFMTPSAMRRPAHVPSASSSHHGLGPLSTSSSMLQMTTVQSEGIKSAQEDPSSSATSKESMTESELEIERLRLMAQKLRAEAAILEAERQEEMAQATDRIFDKFDLNRDGEVTLDELRIGLEKSFQLESIPEDRLSKVMNQFDTNQDGKLQRNEFVTIDQFRNTMEEIVRDEQRLAKEAQQRAQQEQVRAKLADAQLAILNDQEPTTTDKLVSTLPYLFPLLDSIQFGSLLLLQHQENPIAIALAGLYAVYRSIPLSGFLGFLVLNLFSGNPNLNKLVRFNMSQAIYLDIALFVPGLLATMGSVVANLSNNPNFIPSQMVEYGADAVFLTMMATIAYTVGSSLLGITPDKIPIMSQAVQDRMLKPEMFDVNGNFIFPPPPSSNNDNETKKTDNDNDDRK